MSDQKKPTDTAPDESNDSELDDDQLDKVAGGVAVGELPTESVSINYGQIHFEYNQQTTGNDSAPLPVTPRKK